MKYRVIIIIITIILISIYLTVQINLQLNKIKSNLIENLEFQTGFTIKIKAVKIKFISALKIDDLEIYDNNARIITSDSVIIDYKLFDIIFKKINILDSITRISFNNPQVIFDSTQNINKFSFKGKNIDIAVLNGKFLIPTKKIEINNFNGRINLQDFYSKIDCEIIKEKFKANLNFSGIFDLLTKKEIAGYMKIPRILYKKFSAKNIEFEITYKDSVLNIVNLNINNSFNGFINILFNNDKNFQGDIKIQFLGNNLIFGENCNLKFKAWPNKIAITHCNLIKKTGSVLFSGIFDFNTARGIEEFILLLKKYNGMSGKLEFKNNILTASDLLINNFLIKEYKLLFTHQGEIRTLESSIGISINGNIYKEILLNISDVKFIRQGKFIIKNPIQNISISGKNIILSDIFGPIDFNYNKKQLYLRLKSAEKLKFESSIKFNNDININSILYVHNRALKLQGMAIKKSSGYKINIQTDNNISIQGFIFKNLNWLLSVKSKDSHLFSGINSKSKLNINYKKGIGFKGSGDILLYNSKLNINYINSGIEFDKEKIYFSDLNIFSMSGTGVIEFSQVTKFDFNLNKIIKFNANISDNNISGAIKLAGFDINTFPLIKNLSGKIDGNIELGGKLGNVKAKARLKSKEITIQNYKFKNVVFNCIYENNELKISKCEFSEKENIFNITDGLLKKDEKGNKIFAILGAVNSFALTESDISGNFQILGSISDEKKILNIVIKNFLINGKDIPDYNQFISISKNEIKIDKKSKEGFVGNIESDNININYLISDKKVGEIVGNRNKFVINFPSVDLKVLEYLPLGIMEASGDANINLIITFKKSNPFYTGSINISKGKLAFYKILNKFKDLQGSILFHNDYATIENFKMYDKNSKGWINISGNFDINGYKIGDVDLRLWTDEKGMFVKRLSDLKGRVVLDTKIKGNIKNLEVEGKLVLNDFDFTYPFQEEATAIESETLSKVNLNIILIAGENLRYFENINEIDLIVKKDGFLKISGNLNAEHLVEGTLECQEGNIGYLGTDFKIKEAKLTFAKEYGENTPWIVAEAETKIKDDENREYIITLKIDGMADNDLAPSLTSTPALTKKEIFYLLEYGRLYKEYSLLEDADEEKSINRVLTVGILTYIDKAYQNVLVRPIERTVRRKLGLHMLRIRPAIAKNIRESIISYEEHKDMKAKFSPLYDTVKDAEITLGRYLLPNIFLKWEIHMGTDEQYKKPKIEYKHQVALEMNFKYLDFEWRYRPIKMEEMAKTENAIELEMKWRKRF